MSQIIDREGNFRGKISQYSLDEFDSGVVAVNVQVEVIDYWNGEAWDDWTEYQFFVPGMIFIIKKDGTVNDRQVEALVQSAAWDGDVASIADQKWNPAPVSVVVNHDDYHDEFRVAWINDYDRKPGLSNTSPERVKALQAKYGSKLRAVAANASRNTEKPQKGKPPSPPTRKGKTADKGSPATEDDIPF